MSPFAAWNRCTQGKRLSFHACVDLIAASGNLLHYLAPHALDPSFHFLGIKASLVFNLNVYHPLCMRL